VSVRSRLLSRSTNDPSESLWNTKEELSAQIGTPGIPRIEDYAVLLCSTSVDSKPKIVGFVGSIRHSTSYEAAGVVVAYGILLSAGDLGMLQRL
jgi:hypothetical protein